MNVVHCQHLVTSGQYVVKHCLSENWRRVAPVLSNILLSRSSHSESSSAQPVKLAYSEYDAEVLPDRNPIILMHGLFGSRTNWNSLSKALNFRSRRKIISIDARNHGESPHSSEMSYKHMAQDIVKLLNDLELKKVSLIGHSMGGSTMMYFALNFPEFVEKLIVVDISPVRASHSLTEMKSIFQALMSIELDDSLPIGEMRRDADRQLGQIIPSTMLRQFLMMNLIQTSTGHYQWRVNLPVLDKYFISKIATFPNVGTKTFTGSTLFIGGTRSGYMPREDHPGIKKLFPTAQIIYIEGASHWVHADKPQEFLSLVVNFLNE